MATPAPGQHGVGTDVVHHPLDLTGPERGRLFPAGDRGVLDDRIGIGIGLPRHGVRPTFEPPELVRPDASQVVLVCGRTEHPFVDIGVESVLGCRVGGRTPVGDVLPIAADGQPGRVAASRVGAEWRLHHRQDAVTGNPDPVPEALEVIDHPLDGRHDASAGRPGPPHAIEEGLGKSKVARRIGRGGVDERDVGHQRLEQAEGPKRRIDDGEGLVVRHGRADQ